MSKSTTTRHILQDSENKNPDPASDLNSRKHLINGLRSADLKDISNSPLPKRKHEAEDGEREVTPKRKKLIIPLEPDLIDKDNIFEFNPFDHIKLDPVSPRNKDKHSKESTNESSFRSRSNSRSKSKVKHRNTKNQSLSTERTKTKDSVQSAITNWAKKQELNANESVPSFDNKIESTSSSRKCASQTAKKDSSITIDNFFVKSTEKKPKLRSRDKIKQHRHPEYEYPDISPRKRNVESELKASGAVSKLSFTSEGSDTDDSESIFDMGKNSGKRKVKKISYDFDDSDEMPLYELTRKKRKVEGLVDSKKRHKSNSDIKKRNTNKHINGHSKHNRTVDEYFKVGGKGGRRVHSDKSLGEMYEDCISGESSSNVFGNFESTGIVSQEERDRLLAEELQKQFDFENKYHLNAVRLKGSEESYSLRHKKKSGSCSECKD